MGENGDIGSETETRQVMTQFWRRHSQNADISEMMLDSRADEISDTEIQEIFSYLPDYEGKAVLELGAGIGRYTGRIATRAGSVVAVDFMDNFVEKNKATNSQFKNVEFVCNDVLKLSYEEDRFDVIFSNWLFMYIDDKELHNLVGRLLTWLKPGGILFFRESCYKQSGDKKRDFNPSLYRSPNHYSNLVSSITINKQGKIMGFDVVSSKTIDTYVKLKDNKHQICWVMISAQRDQKSNSGYTTFQQFLDQKQYTRNGILRYEKIFGQDYISTGGHATTKEFCSTLGLKKGDKVVDVGCGIGGSAFHMAKEYGAEVVGIDLSSNMIDIAKERLQQYDIPKVSFEVADATKIAYPENSVDLIYSRDTILHIQDKEQLFKNFVKWLKPGGKLFITDYTCGPHDKHSPEYREYVKQRGYNLLTCSQYGEIIRKVGFTNVVAEDKTEWFMEILTKDLQMFDSIKEKFIQEFSLKDFNDIRDGWNDKLKRCGQGDQKWGMFYGEKKI